ncbi:adenylyltransferase and sulfurtransferase MOCS3-like [Acanthaster planci]|uniref:Adenylyltransferase and sulfurtransferase MOCS3 homolog n=1 Tax=Acanthaster planci TaxID=133434 RepID=A0A8B7YBK1_ACAPL|nr:adenylyltransferase and sulfurtransferase MOCS3-like [Acanthaster planci]XP_022089074.1 adenylyltransferase and sulfurtransferase MOCS3-like [Acanthaster planci]XP_022089075.1 adenylyltransferase and sulfurtransferase MOCS3-like [Acanthaster planci]XP_022089076.1 adenylyltransferase and sulfurtransferase MOCS3-like [Acanthaster planci]
MDVEKLQAQLEEARKEIEVLKKRLVENNSATRRLDKEEKLIDEFSSKKECCEDSAPLRKKTKLDNASIERYGRQLILPEIGVKGQLRLCNSSALIVGAGGLGCPAAIYLAAAGIGQLGIVDYDAVELNNLHRQVLHTEAGVGQPKSASVSSSVSRLNSSVWCVPYHMQLDSRNAMDVINKYDIVLDCTDNVATRYLLNDACILGGKPLVSGSALRFEGQLTVYNYEGGPCYRCLYPKPPPPETVTNCSSGGVLGVVPGIIGCFQALEALKIAVGLKASFSQKLLLVDALDGSLRTIKLRPRQPSCNICGTQPSVTRLVDYEAFCGASATDKCMSLHLLPPDDRIGVHSLSSILQEDEPVKSSVFLDVRPAVEFEICHLPHFTNIPIDEVGKSEPLALIRREVAKRTNSGSKSQVLVVCRQGNDSQIAVKILQEKLGSSSAVIRDIVGGLVAWTCHIDPNFPRY